MNKSTSTDVCASLANQRVVLLTTYKRDGTPIGTPVNIAVEGDHAYVRTWDTAWKTKRIRHNAHVLVAPSSMSGKATGPSVAAEAHESDGIGGETCCRAHPA